MSCALKSSTRPARLPTMYVGRSVNGGVRKNIRTMKKMVGCGKTKEKIACVPFRLFAAGYGNESITIIFCSGGRPTIPTEKEYHLTPCVHDDTILKIIPLHARRLSRHLRHRPAQNAFSMPPHLSWILDLPTNLRARQRKVWRTRAEFNTTPFSKNAEQQRTAQPVAFSLPPTFPSSAPANRKTQPRRSSPAWMTGRQITVVRQAGAAHATISFPRCCWSHAFIDSQREFLGSKS